VKIDGPANRPRAQSRAQEIQSHQEHSISHPEGDGGLHDLLAGRRECLPPAASNVGDPSVGEMAGGGNNGTHPMAPELFSRAFENARIRTHRRASTRREERHSEGASPAGPRPFEDARIGHRDRRRQVRQEGRLSDGPGAGVPRGTGRVLPDARRSRASGP
jgi:hypothetical protein